MCLDEYNINFKQNEWSDEFSRLCKLVEKYRDKEQFFNQKIHSFFLHYTFTVLLYIYNHVYNISENIFLSFGNTPIRIENKDWIYQNQPTGSVIINIIFFRVYIFQYRSQNVRENFESFWPINVCRNIDWLWKYTYGIYHYSFSWLINLYFITGWFDINLHQIDSSGCILSKK